MPSVESKPSFSVERIQSAPAVAIVIDDQPFEFLLWLKTLEKIDPNIYCINLKSDDAIKRFARDFSSFDPQKIQLVIADQFYDDHEDMKESTHMLLYMIRDANPQSWIIEMSQSPYPSKYSGVHTNGIFLTENLDVIRSKLINKANEFPNLSLSSLCSFVVNYGHEYASQVLDESTAPNYYFGELYRYSELQTLLDLLGLSHEQLRDIYYSSKDLNTERGIVHGLYTILGHLSAGRNEDSYGLPLARLKQLLGLETN